MTNATLRPDWAMFGAQASRFELAIEHLALAYRQDREEARTILADWDEEAARRGQSRESHAYFTDIWQWLPPSQ